MYYTYVIISNLSFRQIIYWIPLTISEIYGWFYEQLYLFILFQLPRIFL